MTIAAAVITALAAWVTSGALAVTGPGPFTPRVGLLPSWLALAAFLALAIVLIALSRRAVSASALVLSTSYLLLVLLPWLPVPVPRAFLVWTGPVAIAVWVALAAALAAARPWRWRARLPALADPRRAPWIAAAAAAIFFGAVAVSAAPMVPGGDEPHYLIIAQSLLYDGDLKIENNHTRRDYTPYFEGTLRPDYFVRGQNGQIYSVHAPGLSAVIAPAFVLGGYRGVVFFIILVSAAGISLLWTLAYAASGDSGAAWFGTVATAAAVPIAFHSFTVYPDSVAWVIALTGVWALMRTDHEAGGAPAARARRRREVGRSPTAERERAGVGPREQERMMQGSTRAWVLHGVALALLPWLHTRFAFLAALFGLFVLLRLPRTRAGARAAAAFLAVPVVSAVLWFWSFYAIYGTPNPQAPYGAFGRTQTAWRFVPDGLLGALFDQQFGLLLYAPVFFVVFAGWLAALIATSPHRIRRLAIEVAVIAAPYAVAATFLRMWWGGWSAPVRFFVPVLAAGGIFAAFAWRRAVERGTRAAAVAALLVTAFTTVALATVDRGRLAYNIRDGVSLWLERVSPLADLPSGFPSFFRGSAAELALHAAVWVVALLLAWLAVRWGARARLRGRAALAAGTGAAFAVAAMAALTVVWRLERAEGITPAPAQLALVRAAAAGRPIGVRLPPGAVTSADAIVSSVRIAASDRALAGRDRPVFAIAGRLPPGRYAILGPRATPLQVRLIRGEDPIDTLQPDEADIRLPVDVPSLALHGDGDPARLVLQPSHVGPLLDGAPRARRARRYGAAVVYFLDAGAFPEPDAFWIKGGSETDIVVAPDQETARMVIFVRNAPVENTLLISSAGWRDERRLAPGEERELVVPLDAARGATRLRLFSASGFRPADVDARSTDGRYLGVWVQLRTGQPR